MLDQERVKRESWLKMKGSFKEAFHDQARERASCIAASRKLLISAPQSARIVPSDCCNGGM